MKVLIWTQYFWPETFHINAVARALQAQGADVTVLTGKPNYPDGKIYDGYRAMGIQKENYSNIELIRIPIRQRGKNSAIGMLLNYLSFIFSGYIFAPYALRGKKFDAIFVYAPSPLLQALPAIFLAWLKNAPLVLWVQDIWPDALVSTGFIKNRWLIRVVGLAVKYIYRFSDSILIQSEAFRLSVQKWSNRTEVIRFYPNSVEEIPTNVPVSKTCAGLVHDLSDGFSVVFAGNIGVAQMCETIVEAAVLLRGNPAIKFYLIGSGSRAESIQNSIDEKGLSNVVMPGKFQPEDMASIYASASVLLLTLKDEPALSSTIPGKLQTYLAVGKPIVACSNGESARIVNQSRAGISCPAGDAKSLAKAVLGLYGLSNTERERLGDNGRAYFEANFRLKERTKELLVHLETLVANRSSLPKGSI